MTPQIVEHAIRRLALVNQWNDGTGQVGDDSLLLLRYAPRVGQVGRPAGAPGADRARVGGVANSATPRPSPWTYSSLARTLPLMLLIE
jgi:hypothetical protein